MQAKTSTTVRASRKAPPPAARRARRAKSATPNADARDVVAALYAEHGYAARLVDLLDRQRTALLHGRPIDREASIAAMLYMTGHNDAYHHPREDAMFARLAKRDASLVKRIAEIEKAHRTIGAAGKRLLAALQRADKPEATDAVRLATRIGDYVDAMREHMTLEERDLFPRARQLLDDDDLAKIDRAFRRVVDPVFEASVGAAYAEYPPLVRYLAEEPSLREALSVLDALFDSALTLGDRLFSGAAVDASRSPARATSTA